MNIFILVVVTYTNISFQEFSTLAGCKIQVRHLEKSRIVTEAYCINK